MYTGNGELNQLITFVGYGADGTGTTGDVGPAGGPDGKKSGNNVYEVLGDRFQGMSDSTFGIDDGGTITVIPGALLCYDFDSGSPANDAFGLLFGIHNLGLGATEASAAHGDSGGPVFENGVVVGMTDYGLDPLVSDYNGDIDPSLVDFGSVSLDTRISYYADWIKSAAATASTSSAEFRVSQPSPMPATVGNRWSSVAMDASGDFVITWTGYGEDGVGNAYGGGANGLNGIYARRYNSTGKATTDPFLVNTALRANNNEYSRVAMDSAGDFTITWEGFEKRPLPGSSAPDVADSYSIYAQRYVRQGLAGQSIYGPDGELGVEFQVSQATTGDQRYPGIGMDDTGDAMIVWSGFGVDTASGETVPQGVFSQLFNVTADTAGPVVSRIYMVNPRPAPTEAQILNASNVGGKPAPTELAVTFSENLNAEATTTLSQKVGAAGTTLSVASTAGLPQTGVFTVSIDSEDLLVSVPGTTLTGAISASATTSLSVASTAGLPTGTFDIAVDNEHMLVSVASATALKIVTRGVDNTAPVGHAFGAPAVCVAILRVAAHGRGVDGTTAAVHVAGSVVSYSNVPSTSTATYANSVVNPGNWSLTFNNAPMPGEVASVNFWLPGAQEPYNPQTFEAAVNLASPLLPGNYVLTIYSVVQDIFGNNLDGNLDGVPGGNFVIDFTVTNNTSGIVSPPTPPVPSGPVTPPPGSVDQPVNTNLNLIQVEPAVASDTAGDYVVVWTSYGSGSDSAANGNIVAQRFSPYGIAQGPEFTVNSYTTGNQSSPDVAMDPSGDFVVTWCGAGPQDANGVYARIFDPTGTPLTDQFLVNNYTLGDHNQQPKVAINSASDFVVSWSGYVQGQFNNSQEIYYRRFSSDGTPLSGQTLATASTGQTEENSDVAVDAKGDFVVAWQEADGSGLGVHGAEVHHQQQGRGCRRRRVPREHPHQRQSTIAVRCHGRRRRLRHHVGGLRTRRRRLRHLRPPLQCRRRRPRSGDPRQPDDAHLADRPAGLHESAHGRLRHHLDGLRQPGGRRTSTKSTRERIRPAAPRPPTSSASTPAQSLRTEIWTLAFRDLIPRRPILRWTPTATSSSSGSACPQTAAPTSTNARWW